MSDRAYHAIPARVRAPESFRVIAHRGASAYAPENTLPAFQLAAEMGVFEVELDAQLTLDGKVVLCHDDILVRYGHGRGQVEGLTSAALLSLDMGSWFSPYLFAGTPMMTLAQLLDEFGDRFIYHVEIKGHATGLSSAVHAIVEQRGLLDRTIFTSFSYEQLRRMRAVSRNCRLGWLVDFPTVEAVARAQALNLFQLCPRADLVDEQCVKQARDAAPEVRVWGLNGMPHEVRGLIVRAVECGCDGMTINWPDWVTY